MAGKGDRDRTEDRKAYRENHERIFGPKPPPSRLRSVKRVEGPDGGYEVFVDGALGRLSRALDSVRSGDPADLLRELGVDDEYTACVRCRREYLRTSMESATDGMRCCFCAGLEP